MVTNCVVLVKVDERGPVAARIKISGIAPIDFSGNWTELLRE